MKTRNTRTLAAFKLALPFAFILSACGGGGDDGGTTTPPVTGTKLKLTGTVAKGAPLAGAAVTATCAVGSGPAVASSTGVYELSLADGRLPCVLTATSADGATVLHSIAAGTGSSDTTSNITPLSELLIAKLAGADPAAFVAAFKADTPITAASITAAQSAVLQVLKSAGVDTSEVADIVSGSLAAGSGKGYDGVLDKLQAVLAGAGSSLGELTTAVATTSATTGSTSTSTVSTLLAAASTDCAALKSGVHRVVNLTDQTTFLVTVDAAASTATIDGKAYKLAKNAACDFTLNNADTKRVLVAKSGMAVWLDGTGAQASVGISLPEQTLDVASFAGVYNRASFSGVTSENGDFGTASFNATGANFTSMNCLNGVTSCTEDPKPQGQLQANPNGGFDYIDNGQGGVVGARVFAFRNSSGKTLLLALESGGGTTILSAQTPVTLPSVGNASAFWQFTVNPGSITAVTEDSNTISAVNTTSNVVTRQFPSDGHADVVTFNTPYPGMRYRALNACTTSTGAASTCSAVIQTPIPGSGLVVSVSAVSNKHFMSVSINKP